jgi:adenylosuccinate synthase
MVKAYIVLGLGYGDEGKGLVTDYLCANNEQPLVIRFNGGQQAGHTVVTASGQRHVFSNFGSGSFRGTPTFWSAYCSFSPYHFMDEYERLPVPAKLFIDENCLVTTHYDILFNQALEATRGYERYGSCGMGVGATMDRSKYSGLALKVKDLSSETNLKAKLTKIKNYYRLKFEQETIYDFEQFSHDDQDEIFVGEVRNMLKIVEITTAKKILGNKNWQTLIFEGAQGIMLDQTFGNQPYITKSNTTSKNAIQLLAKHSKALIATEIFYVTRCYATRHGAGPFSQSSVVPALINNTRETNVNNIYQGDFRVAVIDADRLQYALSVDAQFSDHCSKNLVITCLDQIVPAFNPQNLVSNLKVNFRDILGSYGPKAEDIKQLYLT